MSDLPLPASPGAGFVRRAGPPAGCLALLLALSLPVGLPGQAMLRLAAMLAAVFHCAHAPRAPLRVWAAFGLGLGLDLLGLEPFGSSALLLVLAQASGAAFAPEAGRGRAGWAAFAAVACGCAALQWLLVSLLSWRAMPVLPGMLLAALAIGLYPVLAALFGLPPRGAGPAGAPIEGRF